MNDSLDSVYREWIETVVSVVTSESSSLRKQKSESKFGINIPRQNLDNGDWVSFFQGSNRIQLLSDSQQWTFSFDSGSDVVPSYRTDKKDQTIVRRLSVGLRSVLCLVRLLGNRHERFKIVWDNNPSSRPSSTAPETPPIRHVWTSMEVVSVASSIGVLHVRLKRIEKKICEPLMVPTVTFRPLNLDEAYIQTNSLGGIEMVIETTTGMTRVNSSGSVAAVSARSFPAYSYQSSSEFICPRKYSEEGVLFGGGSAGGSSEYSWEATEEDVSKQLVNRITTLPGKMTNEVISRYIEKPVSVATIVNEIERIRTSLIEYRIP